ncbi:MAG: hypothetical protein LBG15_07885 [Dysgonamonadaceae bacterium]|jgi:hypothetical protein|nr:hypothetical protein [Dysgonamonadaceae bacterium]
MIFNYTEQEKSAKLSSLKNRLYFALLRDVDIDNFPKAVNATISSNVLLAGKYHYFLDAKVNTINPTGATGESQGNIALTLTPQLEGISRETLNFIYGINGERVIAVWENCETGEKFIAGSPCSGGLLVSVTSLGKMDDGFNGAVLTLTGGECPDPFYFYEGPIIRETPSVIAPGATDFAITSAKQYLLSENTAATALEDITGITDNQVGRIIELLGSGVNYPTTIAPSTTFILSNGIAWSATQGSKLSLQIVKTGTNVYAFYEVARA